MPPTTAEPPQKKLRCIQRSVDRHWVGNGFPVRSVFSYTDGMELSPFLLLDYAAPYKFPPGNEKRGVGGHPHKGFETVTVAYQGEIEHRDSSGGGGKIAAGDVQWMTAGNGIVHEEFHSQDFTRKGGTFQMVQLWVNLRAKDRSAKAVIKPCSRSRFQMSNYRTTPERCESSLENSADTKVRQKHSRQSICGT